MSDALCLLSLLPQAAIKDSITLGSLVPQNPVKPLPGGEAKWMAVAALGVGAFVVGALIKS